MKFIEDFIGNENTNTTFIKENISYTYNNFGHRCKHVKDIDLDNYILFTGCSHTEGEGLNLEDTFPFLTSKVLKCDYYNLGLSATGIDVLFYNILSWLKLFPEPKLIVIQYPDMSRYSSVESESSYIVPRGSWSEKEYVELLIQAKEKGLFLFRNYYHKKLLDLYIENIPTIKLVFGNITTLDVEAVKINQLDKAVDDIHYGPKTHLMCSEIICQHC